MATVHRGMKTMKPGRQRLPVVHLNMDQLHTQNTDLEPRPKTILFVFPTGSELLYGKEVKNLSI